MNNTSVKKANKNLPIEFAVDKTAPTVVVSGVEDDAQYRACLLYTSPETGRTAGNGYGCIWDNSVEGSRRIFNEDT